MKKLLPIIMSLCMTICIISGMTINTYAEIFVSETDYFYLSRNQARENETVTIDVTASTQTGLACVVFAPEYNHDVLELTDIVCNIPSGSFLYNEDSENPKFIWYDTQGRYFDPLDVIFTMTFTVQSGAEEGYYPVSMNYEANNISDEYGNAIPLSISDGEVWVFRFITGDANNDLTIDAADVVYLARYLVGMETEITEGSDVNKDGSIDGRDLVKLARYMIGMESLDS